MRPNFVLSDLCVLPQDVRPLTGRFDSVSRRFARSTPVTFAWMYNAANYLLAESQQFEEVSKFVVSFPKLKLKLCLEDPRCGNTPPDPHYTLALPRSP